jgi:hypothetical protein
VSFYSEYEDLYDHDDQEPPSGWFCFLSGLVLVLLLGAAALVNS